VWCGRHRGTDHQKRGKRREEHESVTKHESSFREGFGLPAAEVF
jgi:hypothetical protein